MATQYVVKKDGQRVPFDDTKIVTAIHKAAKHVDKRLSPVEIANVLQDIHAYLERANIEAVPVYELHRIVQKALKKLHPDVYQSYKRYRDYKKKIAQNTYENFIEADGIRESRFSENAHKNATLASTQRLLMGDTQRRQYMLDFELPLPWRDAHERGDLYIHDLADRFNRTHNCMLLNAENLLRGGFNMEEEFIHEASRIASAFNQLAQVIMNVSSNQYGGLTVNQIDTTMVYFVEKQYEIEKKRATEDFVRFAGRAPETHEEKATIETLATERTLDATKQAYQSCVYTITTTQGAMAQTPFVTFTLGEDQSYWGRALQRIILEERLEREITPTFPKLIFFTKAGRHYADENGVVDEKDQETFRLALRTSQKHMYPDYLSLDGDDQVGEVYRKSGKPIGAMGCRAYLSEWTQNGEHIVNGRGNDGVISLHPLMYALDAQGDVDEFYKKLGHFTDMALDIAYDYRQQLKERKAKSNPLVFVEGGGWIELDPEDTIEKALEGFTTSIGYIGLWETMDVLGVSEERDARQTFQNEVLQFVKDKLEARKAKDGVMYSFYSTPSESLCYTFMKKINKEHPEYKVNADNNTGEENLFETNSFHWPVWKHIGFQDKIEYEAPSHQIANAGHISYVEIVNGMELATIEQIVIHAMQHGMYFGLNFISSFCNECHHRGDFQLQCPECDSYDVDTKNRVCGYLSAQTTHGNFRENPGKLDEVAKRVKHVGNRGQLKSYFEATGETLISASQNHVHDV